MTAVLDAVRAIPRRRVGPLDFSVMPLAEAVALVLSAGHSPAGIAVNFANAYNIALADKDPAYRDLVNAGELLFSDGMPVVWAGRRMYPEIASRWTRVYGPDVMTGVLAGSTEAGPRHYLLGSTPRTLALLQRRIAHSWPDAVVVGTESPPFRPVTDDELAEREDRIRESGATIVWVGLGTFKQDHEVRRLADRTHATAIGVGAAFDFLAGTVPQAPVWMQQRGLEWAFRLATEPRRLAGRYLWGNPRFVLAVTRQAVTVSRQRRSDAHRPRP